MKIHPEKGRTHVTVDISDNNFLSVIQGNEVPPIPRLDPHIPPGSPHRSGPHG